jgi:hypothetical protein
VHLYISPAQAPHSEKHSKRGRRTKKTLDLSKDPNTRKRLK